MGKIFLIQSPPFDRANLDFSSSYPFFSIARDLGSINQTHPPVVFIMGVYRDPVIQFTNAVGMTEQRRALHATLNLSLTELVSNHFLYIDLVLTFVKIDYFLLDFSNAKARADALDSYLLASAMNISETYADIVAVSAREIMGSTELTVSMGTDNQWNMSDIMMFMKDVGRSKWVQFIPPPVNPFMHLTEALIPWKSFTHLFLSSCF